MDVLSARRHPTGRAEGSVGAGRELCIDVVLQRLWGRTAAHLCLLAHTTGVCVKDGGKLHPVVGPVERAPPHILFLFGAPLCPYGRGGAWINRGVFERALAELPDSEKAEKFYIAFAQFEERCKEYERAR